MADREIRVVGVFQDGITPTLNKLNRQLLGTLKQFEKLQKQIAPVAQGMERIGEASATLTNNLKGQRGAIEENIRMLRQYRTELGKTATAQQRMGGRLPKAVTPTEPTGGARPRRRPSFTPQPAFVPPRTRGGGGYGAELGAGVFGMTLGNQLAGIITGAVVSGFQTGARIMTAPFNYGAKAIGERIRDEMSDVRAAGGLFSISRRMQKPLFGTFAEAEEYTKEQNRYLAKLAGSLPGDTQEYIQVSKQIADGIFTIVSQDSANAVKLATELAQTRGASTEEIAKLTAGGPAAQRQAGKELVGEMTKLTVLAGLGGQQGAYGLPQLTERMFAEEQVSMGMFQRYAAIFRDPMIKGALERNIDKINKAGKNTTARLDAIRETYAQIVTPDLVRRYQRTTAGVLESLRTTFLNPEVGLLGLGRPLGKVVQKFNEFGQAVGVLGDETVPLANTFEKNGKLYGYVIDKMGRVTDKFVEVSMEQISIFDRLRDVFANVMIVLEPILNNLASFFDPLLGIGASLDDVRKATMWFQSTFERYRVTMMKEAERLPKELRAQFEGTVPMRSAFQALNNAMVELGAYGDDQFKELSKVIIDPKTKVEEFGNVLRTIVDKFLGSDAAKRIGETIGMIVGTVVAQVGEMMKAAAGLATASKLAEGFAAGFQAAGGPQGFRDIIRSVFALFGKLLIEVIKAAPLETAIAAALFFLPGAIAGVISQALAGGFARALGGGAGGAGGKIFGGGGRGSKGVQRYGAGGSVDRLNRMRRARMARSAEPFVNYAKTSGAGNALLGPAGKVKGAANVVIKGIGKAGKFVPGGAVAAGAIDLGVSLATGENIGKAAAGAIGTVLGATAGSVFGPAGTIIGGMAGSALADMAYSALDPAARMQREAAQMQMDAASKASATEQLTRNLGVSDAQYQFGDIEQLRTRLDYLGYASNAAAQGLLKEYAERNVAFENLKKLETQRAQIAEQLKQQKLPYKEQEKRLAGLNSAIETAKGKYEKEQKDLATKFGQTPAKITDSIVNNINSKMTFTQIEAAIADRIRRAANAERARRRDITRRGSRGSSWYQQEGVGWFNRDTGEFSATNPYGAAKGNFNTPLGKAIGYEMKHKPPGSDLVIANSSETIIPAAGGNGDISSIVNPLQAIKSKTSRVGDYIKQVQSRLSGGISVRVVNQPTVKFDMGGMGPIGGGIGNFPKTSGYGMRWGRMHTGNDYAMPVGTRLGIGGPGKVLFAGNAGGYGKMMDIGGPGGMVYRFAHLSKFNAPVGATLPPGFPFALSGNTGRSTGPHLHFEARPGGMGPVNPDAFAGMIRANYAGTPIGGLLSAAQMEASKMPYGSNLAVGNTDEIFMRPTQMASLIEGSTRAGVTGAGNFEVGSVEVTINDNTGDIAKVSDQAAEMILQSMYRQSRAEVITS